MNDEARMSNDQGMTKSQWRWGIFLCARWLIPARQARGLEPVETANPVEASALRTYRGQLL